MAWRLIETAKEQDFYSCLSTDTKQNADVGSKCWETDTGDLFESYGLGWNQIGNAGSAYSYEQGQIGGERNPSSSTNNYDAVHEEINYSVVSVADNTTTVSNAPTFFYGLYVNSAIGEDLVIEDGSTAVFTVLAASLTANTYIDFGGKGIRFETSLIINPDDTSTETDLIVLWRAIG